LREGNDNIKIALYAICGAVALIDHLQHNILGCHNIIGCHNDFTDRCLTSGSGYRHGITTSHEQKDMIMTIQIGDKIPDVKMVKATADGPQPVQSAEYFAGRKIALFSVPGAFTPTCSAKHLPGFVEKADELKAKGIDEIACTAVNDAFVLGAWNKSGGSDVVTMLADGNAEFAQAVGLTMDGSGFGLGTRGQRFSMVVNDGVVEQLNVEAPGDFRLSSAEHMLGQL
jgi:glutaredoxin/glutathione-dependent peroxiredoxin